MLVQCFDKKLAETVAADLLDIGAVKLRPDRPFVWASGWCSPIYCDNRLSLSFPVVRTRVKEALSKVIRQEFPDAEAVAGVATAGIPQGAMVADALNLSFLYVRSKPKSHGLENLVEGRLEAGQRVVVVEDLVAAGDSALKAVAAVRACGGEVLGIVAVFTYGLQAALNNLDSAGVSLIYLSDYETLLELSVSRQLIPEDVLPTLRRWRENPAGWRVGGG